LIFAAPYFADCGAATLISIPPPLMLDADALRHAAYLRCHAAFMVQPTARRPPALMPLLRPPLTVTVTPMSLRLSLTMLPAAVDTLFRYLRRRHYVTPAIR